MKYNDEEIVQTILTGNNEQILVQLYKQVFPKIRAYICKNSGSEHDALDIFQDSVVVLCKQVKLGKYNPKYEVSAFLYSVSRNLWINRAKKAKRLIYVADHKDYISDEDFSDSISTPERERKIKELISKLGQKCFDLLRHSLFERMPNKEICRIMGFATENSVKTQKYKCKQKLLKLIEVSPGMKEVIE